MFVVMLTLIDSREKTVEKKKEKNIGNRKRIKEW